MVLYEEELNYNVIEKSINYIKAAEVLIIGGTSLTVYPAAGLVDFFNGKYLVIINKTITPYDRVGDLVINEDIDQVFKNLFEVNPIILFICS